MTNTFDEDRDRSQPELFQAARAAALAGVSSHTMRQYAEDGLIRPLRTVSGTRLYTMADIEQAKRIYQARCERHGKTGHRRTTPHVAAL
jgi:hypothetical protein